MSATLSPTRDPAWEEGDFVLRSSPASTVDVLPNHASGTQSIARMTKNALVPLLFGLAAFSSPPVPVRRVFSTATISRSAVREENWLLVTDVFEFTQEHADAAEVRAMNALLNLPVASGLELDFLD